MLKINIIHRTIILYNSLLEAKCFFPLYKCISIIHKNCRRLYQEGKRRLIWVGHAWQKEESLLKTVLENAPQGKRALIH